VARLRNSISGLCHRSLVAFRAVRGLLLFAKELFVAARGVRSCGIIADAITSAFPPAHRTPSLLGDSGLAPVNS
jgi:hypothetical protein